MNFIEGQSFTNVETNVTLVILCIDEDQMLHIVTPEMDPETDEPQFFEIDDFEALLNENSAWIII